jgi:hypothetical protein
MSLLSTMKVSKAVDTVGDEMEEIRPRQPSTAIDVSYGLSNRSTELSD